MRFCSLFSVLIISGTAALFSDSPKWNVKKTDSGTTFFKDLAETDNFRNGLPTNAKFTPDAKSILFLRSGSRDRLLRLFEMNLQTGKTEEILSPALLLKGAAEKLSAEEKARRERLGEVRSGFTSFDLSKDGKQVLLALSGKSYVVERSTRAIKELPGTGWIDPKFSPDGSRFSGVREGELHVVELASGKDLVLTSGATETLTHGVAEFVAQEEFDRLSGYCWSPDSTHLVFEEADLSLVEKLYIPNPADPASPPEPTFYPRAGKANAKVRLGIVPATGGTITWIRWDRDRYPYLGRVQWPKSSPLTIQVLTRDQRELKMLRVDPKDGTTADLHSERDAAWLNMERTGSMPKWLPDGSAFLWITEQRGSTQLELRGKGGEFLRVLTPDGFEVTSVDDIDPASRSVFLSGGNDPRERHLFRVSLDGGTPVQLTRDPGLHTATFAENHQMFLDSANLLDGSEGVRIHGASGAVQAELPSVAEKPPFLPNLEFVRIGKQRRYDALVIRPKDFQPGRKYPVILGVYAGPGIKTVRAASRMYLDEQWMADNGFIIVSLDGRGTPGHGREWERAIKGNFIDVALEDQVTGLKLLGEKIQEMDMTRVGVMGWSFGGYFTAMATIRRPDVFRCGITGAPVTDWLEYDTAYTERYLDLPEVNPKGYQASSVLTYANQLSRPLLIVHGLTDDNVFPVHSLKLMEILLRTGIPFEFLPMPGTHMASFSDPVLATRLNERRLDFFKRNLK